ncbi:TetR/AcrR family transcriptional regulator [Nocardia sp. NPDC003979]
MSPDDHMRAAVLEAVGDLIADRGWSRTSVTAIAARCGIDRQQIFDAFGTRSMIAAAYIHHRLDYLLLEIEAVVECGPTLEDSVATAFECFFDVVDDSFLALALADRRRQSLLLLRTANEQVLTRLAEVIRLIEPTLAPPEARLAAGSVARVALAYLIGPELPRSRAIEQLTALSLTILDGAHR